MSVYLTDEMHQFVGAYLGTIAVFGAGPLRSGKRAEKLPTV